MASRTLAAAAVTGAGTARVGADGYCRPVNAHLVEKRSIDALVTLALSGPSDGAGTWRAWGPGVPGWYTGSKPETPDALGEMLYQANAEATLYPQDEHFRPAPYVFEPMPCEVSVVDGIKTVAHYRYQAPSIPNPPPRETAAANAPGDPPIGASAIGCRTPEQLRELR
jgi:hypothetical protein